MVADGIGRGKYETSFDDISGAGFSAPADWSFGCLFFCSFSRLHADRNKFHQRRANSGGSAL